MIVESKPLHKKKKRLAKQRSAQGNNNEPTLVEEFIVYNRYKELKRKSMEQKENDWQQELELAMANSIVNSLAPINQINSVVKRTPTSTTVTAIITKDVDSIEFIDRTPSPRVPRSSK